MHCIVIHGAGAMLCCVACSLYQILSIKSTQGPIRYHGRRIGRSSNCSGRVMRPFMTHKLPRSPPRVPDHTRVRISDTRNESKRSLIGSSVLIRYSYRGFGC
ncbi:hypothetical protein EDB82DRAFT_506067 [Fusarium venenatum]|uniref:uncharacterized protein n=1 Tax=Fusarium venenatum TaxID=56646 RepID=UPI001D90CE84|nr:hypothetical protein EDB82DRAFT_506067 [Fusarium venenatum]